MSEECKVHKAWIEQAMFEILVIERSEEDSCDQLTYLTRETANLFKSIYEDFAIAKYVANIGELTAHIRRNVVNPQILMDIRKDILSNIFKHNPVLQPENLMVNQNGVVKPIKGELEEGQTRLTNIPNWERSYYDELLMEDDDVMQIVLDEDEFDVTETAVKDIEDIKYTEVKKWWKRINKYLRVKKFESDDIAHVLNQKFFHERSIFRTYIVANTVIDSDDLFVMLDEMGLSKHEAPPVIIEEIYNIILEVNPELTYENALSLSSDDDDDDEDYDDRPTRNKGRMTAQSKQSKKNKKKNNKSFKDVPKHDLLSLAETMKVSVIGQNEAIESIVEAVQRASVGLKDPEKPIGSFLFAGRTGIGKTLTTKVLADELIKDRNNLVTIDCSEYSAEHEYAKLIGAPSGYVGHENGGVLTNAVLENPFSVVVFDEIEKASKKVYDIMLQILEEGRLTDGKGQKVVFKDTIIIMTSNIGVKEVDSVKSTVGFGDVAKLTEKKKTKAIDKAIKDKFKPEFLNRIDAIVHFKDLTDEDYVRIVDLELYKLNDNLKNNDTEFSGLTLDFTASIKKHIFKNGINPDFGARPLKRCIEKEIATPLASRLLKGDVDTEATVRITCKNNKADFTFK